MGLEEISTEEQIRKAFEDFIQMPQNGIPSEAGFDDMTVTALMMVMEFPGDEDLVLQARKELERQFSGEHERIDEALWQAAIARVANSAS